MLHQLGKGREYICAAAVRECVGSYLHISKWEQVPGDILIAHVRQPLVRVVHICQAPGHARPKVLAGLAQDHYIATCKHKYA